MVKENHCIFFPSESTVLSIIAISANSERHSLLPETELQIPTRSKRHFLKKKKMATVLGIAFTCQFTLMKGKYFKINLYEKSIIKLLDKFVSLLNWWSTTALLLMKSTW